MTKILGQCLSDIDLVGIIRYYILPNICMCQHAHLSVYLCHWIGTWRRLWYFECRDLQVKTRYPLSHGQSPGDRINLSICVIWPFIFNTRHLNKIHQSSSKSHAQYIAESGETKKPIVQIYIRIESTSKWSSCKSISVSRKRA